ncbi:uncharacterized protein GIQ15_04304 [Arthroderma uncinatum]|uniref:uncharacterized protein n=1 Tax=Arthroderma uncinatum TaxID=74035 RepID=UPI00144A6516|nr:uncharacterized protein GIQ15_04304 [Arthroderma uncinatum]KAF3481545.1 hypothetical protein GIQ15_04304 [Arthroderma uncinatum]
MATSFQAHQTSDGKSTSSKIEQSLQQGPKLLTLYLLCAILLFSCVESPVIENQRLVLGEMLSWGEEDWGLELQRIENSTDYYLAMHSYLQSIPQFKDDSLQEGEVGKQHRSLAAGIQRMSANAVIQPANPKDERFSALQNLIMLCAGIGWFAALPEATGALRLMVKNSTIQAAYKSPLYKGVKGSAEEHLDSLLLFLEPDEERLRLNGDPDTQEGGRVRGEKRPSPCPACDERPAKR